jgi:hypothetical protein
VEAEATVENENARTKPKRRDRMGSLLGAKFRGNVQQITHAWAGILTLFSLVLNGTMMDRGNDYEAKDFAGTI